jgi:hypothetical protein
MVAITQVSVRPDLFSLAKRRRQAKCNDHRQLLAIAVVDCLEKSRQSAILNCRASDNHHEEGDYHHEERDDRLKGRQGQIANLHSKPPPLYGAERVEKRGFRVPKRSLQMNDQPELSLRLIPAPDGTF